MQKIPEEKILKLIELIRTKPILYKKSYQLCNAEGKIRKDKAWGKIADELNVDVKDCKQAWRSMRDQFFKYSRISNSQGRKYKYSENLSFLKELTEPERKKHEITSAKHDVMNRLQDTFKCEIDPIESTVDDKWTEEMFVENSTLCSNQTKKCGEIMVDIDEYTFILNCFLCDDVCMDLDEFMCHIKVQHEKFLNLDRETESEHSTMEISNTSLTDNALLQQDLDNSNADEGESDECKWNVDQYSEVDGDEDDDYMPKSPTEGSKNSDDDGESNEIDLGIRNKFFVTQLINLLEQHAVLWDNSNSFSKRKRAVMSILKDLIAHYPDTTLTYKTLSNALIQVRQAYRYDRRRMDMCEDESEYEPKHWFFPKIQFLENVCSDDQGAKALPVYENLALPLPNLTDEQHLQLFEIYKNFPCLWDVQHIGYRFKDQRQEALEEMVEAIKTKMNLNFTCDDLKRKMNRVHYLCSQQKQRQLQSEFAEEEFIPTCQYYENFAFLVDNVAPFKCPFCEETFNTVDTYRVHKSKHDGSLPFTCPLCNRGFVNVGNCNVHIRRHTRNFNFECKYCKRGFPTSSEMKVHERIHTGEKPYFCELCGQSFRTWTFFDCHMRRHQKRRSHKCTICSKEFYENHKLKDHMKTHFNIRDKVCNVCDKAFTCSKYLRQHKQIHAEKKKYVCKICGKEFAQCAGLNCHMKSHCTTKSGGFTHEHPS